MHSCAWSKTPWRHYKVRQTIPQPQSVSRWRSTHVPGPSRPGSKCGRVLVHLRWWQSGWRVHRACLRVGSERTGVGRRTVMSESGPLVAGAPLPLLSDPNFHQGRPLALRFDGGGKKSLSSPGRSFQPADPCPQGGEMSGPGSRADPTSKTSTAVPPTTSRNGRRRCTPLREKSGLASVGSAAPADPCAQVKANYRRKASGKRASRV